MLSCFRRQNEFVERNYMTGFFGGEISTLFKYDAFQESLPKPDETAVFCAASAPSGEINCSGRLS